MPTEFDESDSTDTSSQGTLILGTTGIPGSAKIVRLDALGNLITNTGSLTPIEHDQVSMGYSSNLVTSVVYLLSGVTQGTLTMAYDGSDNLTSVVRT